MAVCISIDTIWTTHKINICTNWFMHCTWRVYKSRLCFCCWGNDGRSSSASCTHTSYQHSNNTKTHTTHPIPTIIFNTQQRFNQCSQKFTRTTLNNHFQQQQSCAFMNTIRKRNHRLYQAQIFRPYADLLGRVGKMYAPFGDQQILQSHVDSHTGPRAADPRI